MRNKLEKTIEKTEQNETHKHILHTYLQQPTKQPIRKIVKQKNSINK